MQVSVNRSDVIWSYLGVIVSFISNIISFPIVIYFLDGDLLGLWYVFASIGSITILFDFGFTVTFARNITYCWSGAKKLEKKGTNNTVLGEPDFELMRDILYTCKRIYLLISLIALVMLLTAGTCYIIHISKNIHGNTHIISWVIYAIAAFLNLYYNYYDSFLRGVGCVKQANQNRVYARLTQLVLMLVMLLLGHGILGLSIAYLSFGVVLRFLGKHFFYKYQDIGRKLTEVTSVVSNQRIKELFKTIWYNAWRDGIVSLSVYLSSQASVIICSLYLSLTETGIYSIGMQITSVVAMLSSTLYATYQPALQSYWVQKNMVAMREIMARIIFVLNSSYLIGMIIVIIIGLPLLRMIKPEVIIGVPMLVGIFLSQFIIKYRDCFTSYFSCTNRLIYVSSFIISSIVCVILSVVLLKWFDMKIWGLVIAQIVSQIIFNGWYWSYKAHKELNLKYFQIPKIGEPIM